LQRAVFLPKQLKDNEAINISDEKLKLPKPRQGNGEDGGGGVDLGNYTSIISDPLAVLKDQLIGNEGMKIDRMLFKKFENRIVMDDIIRNQRFSCITNKPDTNHFTIQGSGR